MNNNKNNNNNFVPIRTYLDPYENRKLIYNENRDKSGVYC